MIYRGRVLSVEKDYAVVMTEEAKYLKVIKKNGLVVGAHILFVENDVYRDKRTTPLYLLKYAAVFAIFLFSAVFQLYVNNMDMKDKTVAAIVTLDINPSVEIAINKEERVINIVPLNDDGATILSTSLVGQPIRTAIAELLENTEMKKFLDNGDGFVLISMTPLTDDLNMGLEDIKDDIGDITTGSNKGKIINIIYISGDRTSMEEARLNEISPGRYYLYQELKRAEQSITIELARTMKLKDLINRKRYGNTYRNHSDDSYEDTSRRIFPEEASEHIQIRERNRNQESSTSENSGKGTGNTYGRGKDYGQKLENQSIDGRGPQPEENCNEEQSTSAMEEYDGSQQTSAPDGEMQNQDKNQDKDLGESEKSTTGEEKNSENVDSDKEQNGRRRNEPDNRRQDNTPKTDEKSD